VDTSFIRQQRLNRASVEPRLYICDALCEMVVVISHFVDLYILSYASQLFYHTYALAYANCE
jgi:hypothetical protein